MMPEGAVDATSTSVSVFAKEQPGLRARSTSVCMDYYAKSKVTAAQYMAAVTNRVFHGRAAFDAAMSWDEEGSDEDVDSVVVPRSAALRASVPTREQLRKEQEDFHAAHEAEGEETDALSPYSDAERLLLGARRPMRMGLGWGVYQIEEGRARAWLPPPSKKWLQQGPSLRGYPRWSRIGSILDTEHAERFASANVLLAKPRSDDGSFEPVRG
jgi:hypothetical protein